MPTTQTVDPFQSLSELLGTEPEASQNQLPAPQTQVVADPSKRNPSPPSASPHHAQLLKHYQAGLSSLVSCTGDSDTAPSAFAAFTKLAEASSSSEAGQGLHLSILAWAGRHMVNQGQVKYEAVSERLGEKAGRIILAKLEEWSRGATGAISETERMTLLAGALMVVQFKVSHRYTTDIGASIT
jgi:transcriptional activator protein UGA3